MKTLFRSARILCFALLAAASAHLSAQTRLVISQMYGGGGNTGAQFTNDFLELYNPTTTAISLTGLSIQYASATSASWNSVALPNVSVAPGHYFLIQAAAGTTVTNVPLSPAADFIVPATGSSGNALNFSATAGKVVIANGTAALTVACPAASAYVDLIGYGAAANCFEGTGPAPAPSNTTADIRTSLTVDAINNATDFATGAPTPHSSGSATGPVTPPTVAIHTIQGVKSTTASTVSTYAGQQVLTTGVVTTVLSNAFFIQARDIDADSNPLTPEGIEIFTSSRPTVSVGNYVQVIGTVQTFPAATASHTPATEIASPTVTVLATTATLPAAIAITPTMLTPSGGLYQLTPYEGMRVSIASLTTTSGTNGSITSANEPAELATSNGYFYTVLTGTPRPFREPGIDIRDPAVPNRPAGVALFDDNPERILVDSILSGGTSIEISTGAVLANVTGVLDFTFSSDSFYDPSRLILDATYDRTQVTPGMTVQPVALPAATEFTVASYNIERFYNTNPADDLYYVPAGVNGFNGSTGSAILSTGQTFISAAADNTAAAYTRRLQKISLAIRNVLNSPDIVTLEEVENQSVATDIANQINTDAGVSGLYTAYSTDNATFYTQDGTGISVGFLVKNTVNKLGFTQFGALETFTPATSLITLNDRPWLVLNAGIKRGTAKDYPVTVIVNHMKALTGQNSTTSVSTRLKKELQAEDIAKYIQTLQASGQHVISGGDFNAFEFSDGYNDTLGTYTNTNVLAATQVVQPGVPGLVTPPLTDLALTLPANQRWSYQEDGSAQILDHMVVTPELVAAGAHFAYAHLNADFPLTAYNDATTPARTSDHDVAVGYFTLPAPVLSATLTPATATAFGSAALGTSSAGQVFTLTNTGEAPIAISGVTVTGGSGVFAGDFAVTSTCPATLVLGASCSANVVFTPTATGTRAGTLTFATGITGSTFTVALTGTGTPAVLPVLTSTALTFASTPLGTNSAAQTLTLTNPSTLATPIASIAVAGDFTQTNNCGASIAARGTCTITVIFIPTLVGSRPGSILVTTTGIAATTLTTSLTGSGTPAVLPILTPASLTFPNTLLTASSTAQTLTLTNPSTLATPIASIAVTGDFTQTNTCGASIAPSGTCTIAVVFKPTVAGARTGTVTVTTTGVAAATLNAALTGGGVIPDFTLADSSGKTATTLTLTAGQSGAIALSFAPANGFTGSITITCAAIGTAPVGVTCNPPASFTLGASASTQNVGFITTPRAVGSGLAITGAGSPALTAIVISLTGLLLLLAARARRLARTLRLASLLSLVLAVCCSITGCSSGTAIIPGTTPGTYTYAVTATSGALTHTETVTLIVQ